jgi:hypothetical protein
MINRFIFSQMNLDSGSLTVLASVAHQFSELGEYFGEVRRGNKVVGRFKIFVGEKPVASQLSSAVMQPNVKIDLKEMELTNSQQPKDEVGNCFMLKPDGYALFLVSTGAGIYEVEIHKPDTSCGGSKIFDNRELKEKDLFVATLLRPGTYSIKNTITQAEAELVVVYPEIGKTPTRSPPVRVKTTEKAIIPQKIIINPAQGLVFSFTVPSRIKIELVKPEDRPQRVQTEKDDEQKKTRLTEKSQAPKVTRRLKLIPR